MQAYRVYPGRHPEAIELFERDLPPPAAHEVRVKVRAVSLNYRDLMVTRGSYPVGSDKPLVPTSDGAGEVVAVGAAVTRFRPGDRVISSFFPHWIDGQPTRAKTSGALGAEADGMLAQEVLLPEDALSAMPAHLSFAEAATLPCAGVTAWNSLFVEGALKPGDSVLMLGTGGVSIWALQLAKAAGLRTIITSSSAAKLERARALGASATINYVEQPEWQEEVLRQTGGEGVNLVLEVGGQGTLARSMAATRMGGSIAIIGGVSGFGGEFNPFALITGAKHLSGIFVGSRSMAEDLVRFVEIHAIHPVVDKLFPFEQAVAAYAYLEAAGHFGKVVITLD
ncbi:zinc-dependent alcohol dehydrogenase family protein [Dyella silvatica]|uniref:zinc-dependent alcohol dehydrogenase family protein n=1 Tax=Dyella silvatica TaxID=2992128 RepID=UPI0022572FC7|nr:NAD(P)-dependent alcohol dehydrogenase [Dyella silvatica]